MTPPNPAPDGAPFAGRLVVLTGVARRGQVGEVVTRSFAVRGARVALLDRDGREAEARATELRAAGGDAVAFACDLTDHAALGRVAATLDERHPAGCAALVCLAGGFGSLGPVAESDPAQWDKMLAINLATAFATTRAFLPALRRARGRITYFASAAAIPGGKASGIAAYAVAKGGIITLMHAVAAEERESGVCANALAPTTIRTDSNVAAMGDDTAYVERETVAEWVTFLSDPASGPVTGQVIRLG